MTRKKVPRCVKKRPYRAPELWTYGDLRALTTAKKGKRWDGGGNPRTRQ